MSDGTFMTVTVVTGVLVLGVGVALARLRRVGGYTPTRRSSVRRLSTAEVGAIVGTVALVAVALVVDPLTMAYLVLAALVGGFFAWGVYSLARVRGLPKAHSVGLSAWLFGMVLIGVVAVQLLLG